MNADAGDVLAKEEGRVKEIFSIERGTDAVMNPFCVLSTPSTIVTIVVDKLPFTEQEPTLKVKDSLHVDPLAISREVMAAPDSHLRRTAYSTVTHPYPVCPHPVKSRAFTPPITTGEGV